MSHSHDPYAFDPHSAGGPQDTPPGRRAPHDHGGRAPQAYGPPGYGYPQPYAAAATAPFGTDPMTGEPYSDRSKVVAGLLQIFLGGLGVGRFYMGTTGIAVAQLVLTLVGLATTVMLIGFVILFGVGVWTLVDGVVILAGRPRDGAGRLLRP